MFLLLLDLEGLCFLYIRLFLFLNSDWRSHFLNNYLLFNISILLLHLTTTFHLLRYLQYGILILVCLLIVLDSSTTLGVIDMLIIGWRLPLSFTKNVVFLHAGTHSYHIISLIKLTLALQMLALVMLVMRFTSLFSLPLCFEGLFLCIHQHQVLLAANIVQFFEKQLVWMVKFLLSLLILGHNLFICYYLFQMLTMLFS